VFKLDKSINIVYLPGNPLEEKHSQEGDWKELVAARLKKLRKLDGLYPDCFYRS